MQYRRQEPRARQEVSAEDIEMIFEALPKVEGRSLSSDMVDDMSLELAVMKFVTAMEKCRAKPFELWELNRIMDKINAIRDEFMVQGAKL